MEISATFKFNIQYWCCPVQNLIKGQNLFQRGRKVSPTGFITDQDQTCHMLQVDVYSVSVATNTRMSIRPCGLGQLPKTIPLGLAGSGCLDVTLSNNAFHGCDDNTSSAEPGPLSPLAGLSSTLIVKLPNLEDPASASDPNLSVRLPARGAASERPRGA
ncbi:hypothetical protein DFH28DRAFT_924881 [Melampsora americana]|nr:hypothetical protein DFH28DRAFT_924881 [Melampsora americana]